ncbi:MAG: 2Fe-2S iron-sulfur cluster binding domain-containing protein [Erysipelotrichaceae bacterium]|nr:2Fe-2S iron-sulfur cluster binding domain-containing protein [Erysipelotrichaceae bacterium]
MTFRRSDNPAEDINRGLQMPAKRRELIAASSDELPVAGYGVNALAAALHPGFLKARIVEKQPVGVESWRITLKSLREDGRFPYFRAGQFVTLSDQVEDSFISRPYSISSSPKQALEGKLEIIVQRKGIFSQYLIDKARIGALITVSEPAGDFFHDDIRDAEHVLAVAGGSGVTPFISMMKAIQEGSEDFRLTLIYGVRTRKHLIVDSEGFSDERIRIIPVLSDEQADGYYSGFINADILGQFADKNTSVFMCGPDAMYDFVTHELDTLGISRIRRERNCVSNRRVDREEIYRLTVHIRDEVYALTARNDETVITALERAGIPAVVRCRSGVCGFCHSRLISGEYFINPEDDFRRQADRKFGYIHPCCCYPESDMEIEIPIFDLGG